METVVVAVCCRVACCCDDADFDVAAEEGEEAGNKGGGWEEGFAVVVEGYVSVKGCELEGGGRGGGGGGWVWTRAGTGDGEDLGGVEDEADVVEGRGDVAAGGDEAFCVHEGEGCFEGEAGEEGPC